MASASSSAVAAAAVSEPPPSATQLLFAKAVIYTFELWPALRLAISEQWGGFESKAKADFLISYVCDQYSEEKVDATGVQAQTPPITPDVDDLADILEGYFADEYEGRLEDDSGEWVAGRLVQLHKIIYAAFPPTVASLHLASEEISKLEQAALALRGKKVSAQQQTNDAEESVSGGSDEEQDDEDSDSKDAMHVDSAVAPQQVSRPEPIVDEDGFTTVVKSKRR